MPPLRSYTPGSGKKSWPGPQGEQTGRQPWGKLLAKKFVPRFLTAEHYVEAPLESTYQQEWDASPRGWRELLAP